MNLFFMTATEIDAVVGANLHRLRDAAGMPRSMAASSLGLHPNRLAAAEAGTMRLDARELSDAVLLFGCSWAALFMDPGPVDPDRTGHAA